MTAYVVKNIDVDLHSMFRQAKMNLTGPDLCSSVLWMWTLEASNYG